MQTLLLDINTWDLVVDTMGNIAVASNPYSLAQDAASAIRLFEGELYWDTTKGVPYFDTILGFAPPPAYMKTKFNEAAMTVPEVVAATSFITSFIDRVISGQVQVTDTLGQTAVVNF